MVNSITVNEHALCVTVYFKFPFQRCVMQARWNYEIRLVAENYHINIIHSTRVEQG